MFKKGRKNWKSINCYRDLSETAIEGLPIAGLKELEILKIENTHTMQTIPSIYDLSVGGQSDFIYLLLNNAVFSESKRSQADPFVPLLRVQISWTARSRETCAVRGKSEEALQATDEIWFQFYILFEKETFLEKSSLR